MLVARSSGVARVEVIERFGALWHVGQSELLDVVMAVLDDVASVHYAAGLLDAGREFVAELRAAEGVRPHGPADLRNPMLRATR